MMKLVRSLLVVASCLAALTAKAADPFHERLLDDGTAALERGDHQVAIETLDLACFGFLDEPAAYVDCLTLLAVAEGESGQDTAFLDTFALLLEAERRVVGLSVLARDPPIRGRFETLLRASVSAADLGVSPSFRALAREKWVEEVAAMPPAERRKELARRLESDPDYLPWHRLAAEAALADERWDEALIHAERLLAAAPQDRPTRCLHGRAAAGSGACEAALPGLAGCTEGSSDPSLAATILSCQIQLARYDEAAATLAALDSGVRRRRPIRALEKQIERARRDAARAQAATEIADSEADDGGQGEGGAAAGASPSADDDAAEAITEKAPAPPPTAELSDAELAELDAGARLLATRQRSNLRLAFDRLQAIADRHPGHREAQHLTAEAAYLQSRWNVAVSYFQRGGEIATDRPERQFYFSVALYESGDRVAALEALDRCLPHLQQTDFVRAYIDKIRGGSA